jgi:hypothetical protein
VSDVVEKQIRTMLSRYKEEIQKAASQTTQSGNQMASGLKKATSEIQALLSVTQKLNADGNFTQTRKGYDDLGRSITEVYKNGQLLHRTMSVESTLSKDIQYANKLYQEQAEYLKRIYALKTKRLT